MFPSITFKPALAASMLATLDVQRGFGNRYTLQKKVHDALPVASLARPSRFTSPVPKRARAVWTLLWVLLSVCGAWAQSSTFSVKRVTGHIGFGGSSKQGYLGTYGLQAVTNRGLAFSLSYLDISVTPKNQPEDYDPGFEVFFLFPVPNSNPEAALSLISATAGKSFEATRTLFFTAQAGLSLVKGDTYTYRRQEVTTDIWGGQSPNYATSLKSKSTVGVLLKGEATWAFSSFAGLGAGVFAHLNSVQSPVGMDVRLVLGWMNRASKKRA